MKFRQGDILLTRLDTRVEKRHNAREIKPKNGRLILAEGEVTGHTHGFEVDDDGPLLTLFVQSGYNSTGRSLQERTYLSVEGGTALLTHDEHGTIELPEGDYEVGFQQEYVPNFGRVRVWD